MSMNEEEEENKLITAFEQSKMMEVDDDDELTVNENLFATCLKGSEGNSKAFFEKLRNILLHKADVNFKDQNGKTVLHWAVCKSDINLIKWLLNQGADSTLRDNTGKTATETARFIDIDIEEFITNFKPPRGIVMEFVHRINGNTRTWHLEIQKKVEEKKIVIIENCNQIDKLLNIGEFYENIRAAVNSNPSCFIIVVQTTQPMNLIQPDLNLKGIVDIKRPLVIFFESSVYKDFKIYFKDSKSESLVKIDLDQRISLQEFQVQIEQDFSFETVLQALRSDIFGTFDGTLLNIRLNPEKYMEYFSLNNNAKKWTSILCLRFLGLFADNSIASLPNLEVAAKDGRFETFVSLLDLPFSYDSGVLTSRSDLIESETSRYKLLEIAANRGNSEALRFLLNCGYDINNYQCDLYGRGISNSAWEGRHDKALLTILEADGCHPENFHFADFRSYIQLSSFVRELEAFHENITDGNLIEVKKFVTSHRQLKHAYLTTNESALSTALKMKQIEIYAFLRSKQFVLGRNENSENLKNSWNQVDHEDLRKVQAQYFNQADNYYLTQLYICSRLGFAVEEFEEEKLFRVIKDAYERLDKVEYMKPILETVGNCRYLQIVFDFNRDCVHDLVPAKENETAGRVYTTGCSRGYIYIGAKGLLDDDTFATVLGTLAHEVTHYAMDLLYENSCNPYREEETLKKTEFENVVRHCSKLNFESIIDVVKQCHIGEKHHAELIVRVPHTLTLYFGDQIKIRRLKTQYSKLFQFYSKYIDLDLKKHYPTMKGKQLIQDVNNLYNIMSRVQSLGLQFMPAIQPMTIDATKKNQHFMCDCVKVTLYQIFQALKSSGDHIFAKIEFVNFESYRRLIKQAYESNLKPTLFIDCSTFEENLIQFKMFIEDWRPKNRVVFVTEKNVDLLESLYNARTPEIFDHSWDDFTPECRINLLNHKINFQDKSVELNKLVNVSSESYKFIPLEDIFAENVQAVENIPDLLDQEIISYYVDRKFITRRFTESTLEDLSGTSGNNDFKYLILDTDQLIEEAKKQNILVIADDAGMGKTTALKMIIKKMKDQQPLHWQVFLDLKQHVDAFDKERIEYWEERIESFFVEKLLKLHDTFRQKLFAELFKEGRVTIFCDGLDEICPTHEDFVSKFFKAIHETSSNQLWITSRLNVVRNLENLLHTNSVKLTPFSKKDQCEFLRKYLSSISQHSTDQIQEMLSINETILQVPLQLKMLADICENGMILEGNEIEKLVMSPYVLYENFVQKKLIIWQERSALAREENAKCLTSQVNIVSVHHKWAIKILLGERFLRDLQFGDFGTTWKDVILRVGMMTDNGADRVKFKHETFAEYFLSEYIFTKLFKCDVFTEVQLKAAFIFVKVLLEEKHQMVRMFLNSALDTFGIVENSQFNDYKRSFIKLIIDLKDYSFLQNSVRESCFNIVNIVFYLLKGEPNIMEKVWNSKDKFGRNLLLSAVFHQKEKHFVEYFMLSKQVFNNKLKLKKYLLESDNQRSNAFHIAASFKSVAIFEALWTFANEVSTKNELQRLLLNKNMNGKNILSLSVGANNEMKLIELILSLGEKYLTHERYRFFLTKITDKGNCTILHEAAANGTIQTFNCIWLAVEQELTYDTKRQVLLQKDKFGRNLLITAFALNRNEEVIKKLEEIYKEVINVDTLKTILTQRMKQRKTALHLVSTSNNLEILKMFLRFCQELFSGDGEIMRRMITSEDSDKRTAFELAAACNKDENVILKLWNLSKELLGIDYMKEVLQRKDGPGNTPVHLVTRFNTSECLKMLLTLIDTTLSSNEQKSLILEKGEHGRRVLAFAAANNPDKNIITIIWDYYKKLKIELKDLLTEPDTSGASALELAASFNNKELLETIWSLTVETHSPEELVGILTRKDNKGRNLVFRALTYNFRKDVVDFLWALAENMLDPESKKEFISARNNRGDPAIVTAYNFRGNGNSPLLRGYWKIVHDNFSRDEQNETLTSNNHKVCTKKNAIIAGVCCFIICM